MNLTFDKKKCILLATWLLIGILSFTVVGKYAAAPESHHATITSLDEKKNTVLELCLICKFSYLTCYNGKSFSMLTCAGCFNACI